MTNPASRYTLPHQPVRIEAAGTDVDAAMTELPGIYAGQQRNSHVTDDAYAYRYAAVGDDLLTLRRSQMTGFIRGKIPPSDDYVVQWIDAVPVGRASRVRARHRLRQEPPWIVPAG